MRGILAPEIDFPGCPGVAYRRVFASPLKCGFAIHPTLSTPACPGVRDPISATQHDFR
jgi:hypothetical protein